MKKTINITNGVTRHPQWRMAQPVNLEILQGEQVALIGTNGAGKSRLVEIITGHYPLLGDAIHYDFSPSPLHLVSENMKYIAFRDSYGDQDATYYYQQRWNQHDIDESTPTVGQLLQEAFRQADESAGHNLSMEEQASRKADMKEKREALVRIFHLDELYDKYIISLSGGELRKFQLAKALGSAPRMLIMDNPFIGLDVEARKQLNDFLTLLVKETNVAVVLVLSKTDDIPEFITHVVPVKDMAVQPKMTLDEYRQSCPPVPARLLSEEKAKAILSLPYGEEPDEAETGTRQGEYPLRQPHYTQGPQLHRHERRALGSQRRERSRQVHTP